MKSEKVKMNAHQLNRFCTFYRDETMEGLFMQMRLGHASKIC